MVVDIFPLLMPTQRLRALGRVQPYGLVNNHNRCSEEAACPLHPRPIGRLALRRLFRWQCFVIQSG